MIVFRKRPGQVLVIDRWTTLRVLSVHGDVVELAVTDPPLQEGAIDSVVVPQDFPSVNYYTPAPERFTFDD